MSENPYAISVEDLVATAQVAPEAQIEVQTEYRAVVPDRVNLVHPGACALVDADGD